MSAYCVFVPKDQPPGTTVQSQLWDNGHRVDLFTCRVQRFPLGAGAGPWRIVDQHGHEIGYLRPYHEVNPSQSTPKHPWFWDFLAFESRAEAEADLARRQAEAQ